MTDEQLAPQIPQGNTVQQFTIGKEVFLSMLRKVANSSGVSVQNELLANVLLDASNGGLAAVTTDLETGTISRTEEVTVKTEGASLLPLRNLLRSVSLAGDSITIVVDGPKAVLKTDRSEWTFQTADPDLFPSVPIVQDSARVTPLKPFQDALTKVYAAASTDNGRPSLAQIHVTPEGLFATDGTRVHFVQLESVLGSFDIPSLAVKPLLSLMQAASSEAIYIDETETHLTFGVGRDDFSVRRLEAEFPPVNDVIILPRIKTHKIQMVVSREALSTALKRSAVVVGDSGVVMWDLTTDKLVIQCQGTGQFYTILETNYKGAPRSTTFAISAIRDALDLSKDELVTMLFSSNVSDGSLLLVSGTTLAAVMPRAKD